jgi:hypothetical protein
MTWNAVMGLISTIALSLPILILIATKLAGYKSFPALLAYYAIVVGYNLLTEGYIHAAPGFIGSFGITNNLLDAPLMLTFLAYFSTTSVLKQRMKILVAAFVAFEIIVIAIFGFSLQTLKIVMGPGLLLVLAFCLPFFVRYAKTTVIHQKTTGKAMITAAILFAYGCYSIIYVMYYLMDSKDTQNAFLVYFFVSTFSSILLGAGIFVESKRVKKLSELKVVRKELSELYPNDKMAAPLRPAIFDFDKEQWN